MTATTARVPAERIAAELRRHWLLRSSFSTPAPDQGLVKLQSASARFLAGEWLPIALGYGWDELEIWGAFPAALEFARRRGDCLGPVPSLITGRGFGRPRAAVCGIGAVETRKENHDV